MSRARHDTATLAVCICLLVAASPLGMRSPIPVSGVRTALELIAGKGAGKAQATPRPVPHGTA